MILIIDDDSAIRSSLSFMLKRAKYDVQAVPGPKEAIEIVRSVAPQLILMDMNFTLSTSGEEGLTLLKQVKVFRPDVPVILMTAWGSMCHGGPDRWYSGFTSGILRNLQSFLHRKWPRIPAFYEEKQQNNVAVPYFTAAC